MVKKRGEKAVMIFSIVLSLCLVYVYTPSIASLTGYVFGDESDALLLGGLALAMFFGFYIIRWLLTHILWRD